MSSQAGDYPTGYSFFLLALLGDQNPPEHVVCVLKKESDRNMVKKLTGLNRNIIILEAPEKEYPLVNDQTTFYVCKNNACLPPTNEYGRDS